TGASANAFTSFDRTCYLFSCSDNFDENLDILLNFVQSPYFTKETVEKEQGIIG
ncbi:MAG: insulinase family protein, partial [Clostridia bacterium]|nr:insulinase family protein [Clostridia bacterium]